MNDSITPYIENLAPMPYGAVTSEKFGLLRLTNHPVATQGGAPTVAYYAAGGVDRHGNSYILTWDIVDARAECPEDACDWDMFDCEPV